MDICAWNANLKYYLFHNSNHVIPRTLTFINTAWNYIQCRGVKTFQEPFQELISHVKKCVGDAF